MTRTVTFVQLLVDAFESLIHVHLLQQQLLFFSSQRLHLVLQLYANSFNISLLIPTSLSSPAYSPSPFSNCSAISSMHWSNFLPSDSMVSRSSFLAHNLFSASTIFCSKVVIFCADFFAFLKNKKISKVF